jgi:hypothetical protein
MTSALYSRPPSLMAGIGRHATTICFAILFVMATFYFDDLAFSQSATAISAAPITASPVSDDLTPISAQPGYDNSQYQALP